MIKHCPSVTSELNRDPHEAKDSLGNFKDVTAFTLEQCWASAWLQDSFERC